MAKLDDLREIAKAVARNKVKNIQIIGNSNTTPTIFNEFYEALLDNKFDTDEEYSQYFYNESTIANKAFYKLKDRLEERMINTLFFVDINGQGFLPIQKAYYQCYKNAVAVKILIGRFIRKPAISLAEKTFKKSSYYNFTTISLELAQTLRLHYGSIDGDKKKYLYYNKQIVRLLQLYQAELTSEEYYLNILIHYIYSNSLNIKLTPIIKTYHTELNKIKKKFFSYKINLYTNFFCIVFYEIQNDWNNVIKTCNDAISYLKKHPQLASPSVKGNFLLKKITGLLVLRRFEEGIIIAQECLSLFPLGSINYLLIADIYFKIYLHAGQFENAKEIFHFVRENVNVNSQYPAYTEIWKIHEAFINYLILIGKIDAGEGKEKLPPFRMSKFLNEVPIYSKDKRGSNITILILQILFLLEDQKYDAIIDRAESLKTYTQRYLKDDDTFRSSCFIKMLLCLPAADFQKDKILKKAKKYIQLLHSVPIEKAKQSVEIEVIPYEMLWEFVLESIDRQDYMDGH